ncbi:cytochrome c oxidase assembly protein [Glycomyces halotolerans]
MSAAPLHHMSVGAAELFLAAAAIGAALLYSWGTDRLRRRGDTWPWHRDAAFTTGAWAIAYVFVDPLPGGPFTAHMGQHLIIGMAAPLLLVLARPLTLAFRALGPGPARRTLLALAGSRRAAWFAFPPAAALLDIGGLWLLYRTPLFAAVQHQPAAHILLQLHVLAAGILFTFAVCQLDPVRHRWNLAWRGTTLIAAGAAHAILAKTLYTTPPPDTAATTTDLQTGAQLMYYGGDLIELALAAVIALHWYTATGRTRTRQHRHTTLLETQLIMPRSST